MSKRAPRLQPAVPRRGYQVGAAQLRIGSLVHLVAVVMALGAVAGTAMTIAALVNALELL